MIKEIYLKNGESYQVEVIRQPDSTKGEKRHEVVVLDPNGLSTGETMFGEDNPTYAWCFPVKTPEKAIEIFVNRIESLRESWGYYL